MDTKINKKYILVTGGAGFIGYHLCNKFLQEGHNVICIDNLLTGKQEHITLLNSYKNFFFLNFDIVNHIDIDILHPLQIYEIYHLACPASPKFYQKNAVNTLKTCFIGTLNILEFALKKKSKVLFTSTSEIYGNPLEHPQTEEYFGNVNSFGPRSCYDEGKRVAESLIYAYKNKGLDIRICRIFNTYGPFMNEKDGRVIYNFIGQAISNNPITIYGDGTQTRSFCFIDDTINCLIKLMHSNYTHPINIGNNNEVTIKNLALTIKSLVQSDSEFVYKNMPMDDPIRRCPDISKAKSELNWDPRTQLIDGLIHTIYYYKTHIGVNQWL